MAYINFAALKEKVSITDAALMLNLPFKYNKEKNQLRCACPACESGDERALVITPDKNVFFCHEEKTGGDILSLVAHIKELGMKQAAEWIVEKVEDSEEPEEESKEDPAKTTVWAGLDYLQYEHELMEELGFDSQDCEKIGIGFANKGLMRGRVAIPIRLPTGQLIGYVGVAENVKIPRTWNM